MRTLMAEKVREHMGMRPFWRCLTMSRNTLIDFKSGKTADKDPMWAQLRHDLHERVVRCKERTTKTRPQMGERLGISGPYAHIDLCGTKSKIEQYRSAILWP
jgi:hypothetical protein